MVYMSSPCAAHRLFVRGSSGQPPCRKLRLTILYLKEVAHRNCTGIPVMISSIISHLRNSQRSTNAMRQRWIALVSSPAHRYMYRLNDTCIDFFTMRSACPLEEWERVPSCLGRVNRLSWPMEGVRWSGHCPRRADCEQHIHGPRARRVASLRRGSNGGFETSWSR